MNDVVVCERAYILDEETGEWYRKVVSLEELLEIKRALREEEFVEDGPTDESD